MDKPLTPIDMFEFKTKPYAHQLEALKRSCFLKEYGYLMEMGTGKSYVIITNACILFEAGKIRALMIIAPNAVYRNWINTEIPTHMPDRILGNARWYIHKEDTTKKLTTFLDNTNVLHILVFNVEAFSRNVELTKLLCAWMDLMPALLALDESTTIKQLKAKRTKNILKLSNHAEYKRIATGLVAPNGPMDVFAQFEFLRSGCLGTRSPVEFQARYCEIVPITFGRRAFNKVVGSRNLDDLQARMAQLSYRITKEECLDLPPKSYQFYESELDEASRGHYKTMSEQAIMELECEDQDQPLFIRSANRINMMMRLQMITCGHIKDADGVSYRFSSKRIEDTLEFLHGCEGSVVLWSTYVRDIQDLYTAIQKEFGASSVVHFYGETSTSDRDEATRKFQAKKVRFMISNPATGRFGNTWTAASTAFYYSNNYDLEHRSQSEERIHRIGQFDPCLYVDMLAPKTVNMPMVQSLRKKINMASAVMGDTFREWLV